MASQIIEEVGYTTNATIATESFTEAEAKAKIGKTVRLLADYNQLFRGEIGQVVDFHETTKDVFEVVIRWNLQNGLEPVYVGCSRANYDRLLSEE